MTVHTVEIIRPRDETTDPEDEDMSDEYTSGDEKTSEEDDNDDGEEPSGTTLNSESSYQSEGVSTDISDDDYRPRRSSCPRQSSDESATTTQGQGQEQEHDNIEGGESHERGNRTIKMIKEEVFGAEAEKLQGSLESNTV